MPTPIGLEEACPAVLPDLDGLQYHTSSQNTPIPVRHYSRSLGCWRRCCSWWRKLAHFLLPFRPQEKSSSLLRLPTEILQAIASELPLASRASFALSCKTLLAMERDPQLLFQAFQFPAQQPHDFWTRRMSKPGVYQPTRWEFLRLLERDRRGGDGDWLVCSECFTLHPKRMFAPYRESIVPWLRQYYEARDSDFRTCRHGRGPRSRPAFSPSGIVELCPRVKMTVGKKRLMEAWLRQKQKGRSKKQQGPAAADFWWHECRHVDGAIEIETKIGLFLYDGSERRHYTNRCVSVGTNISRRPPRVGELGVLLEYRHQYPSSSSPESNRSPRRLCPHHNLHGAIQELLRCGATHPKSGQVCLECGDIQYCQYCRTKVLDLRQSEDTAPGLVECSYRVERCLDGAEWPMHTMFPFARRQMPLLHIGPRRYAL